MKISLEDVLLERDMLRKALQIALDKLSEYHYYTSEYCDTVDKFLENLEKSGGHY